MVQQSAKTLSRGRGNESIKNRCQHGMPLGHQLVLAHEWNQLQAKPKLLNPLQNMRSLPSRRTVGTCIHMYSLYTQLCTYTNTHTTTTMYAMRPNNHHRSPQCMSASSRSNSGKRSILASDSRSNKECPRRTTKRSHCARFSASFGSSAPFRDHLPVLGWVWWVLFEPPATNRRHILSTRAFDSTCQVLRFFWIECSVP